MVYTEKQRRILGLKTFIRRSNAGKTENHLVSQWYNICLHSLAKNSKNLSLDHFSQCRLKSNINLQNNWPNESVVSIPCCKQLFRIWAGHPIPVNSSLTEACSFANNIMCGGMCYASTHCTTVITWKYYTFEQNYCFWCVMNILCSSLCCFIRFSVNMLVVLFPVCLSPN